MFNFFRDRKILKALERNKISFYGYGGLSFDGLVVNEFRYLIKFMSKGKVNNFDDFYLIVKNKQALIESIQSECQKAELDEEKRMNISRDGAIANQKNLQNIIIGICGLVEDLNKIGVTVSEARMVEGKKHSQL